VSKDVVGARDEIITRVEEKSAIVREEGGPELKGRGIPLAVRMMIGKMVLMDACSCRCALAKNFFHSVCL
jgi:hypothetical protein